MSRTVGGRPGPQQVDSAAGRMRGLSVLLDLHLRDLPQRVADEQRIIDEVAVSEPARLAQQSKQPFEPERCIQIGARGFVPA